MELVSVSPLQPWQKSLDRVWLSFHTRVSVVYILLSPAHLHPVLSKVCLVVLGDMECVSLLTNILSVCVCVCVCCDVTLQR